MQDGIALERKTKEELKQIAQGLEIEKISALKKDELIAAIRAKREENENLRVQEEKSKHRPNNVTEVSGILDVMNDGFGFLRCNGYKSGENDVYVSPAHIRRFNLRTGDLITGDARPSEDKYAALLYVKSINGENGVDAAFTRKPFEKLTPIYPKEKLKLETFDRTKYASRLIDIIAPIGKGQRGMIVAPPKAGKTTLIKQIAQSIKKNNPEIELIVLLIDERPEEVTDLKRSINGEVVASTFDQEPVNHMKTAEMVIERACRLVEHKKDVVILLDSITRLARAYNNTIESTGRTLSGGLDPNALIKPKKFFGAARNIEDGGSLTILATALVETGSRMDDVIFEEFKGTGNMELRLDRTLQENRIFPAIDILKSGTRREEELLSKKELDAAWAIRRDMNKLSPIEVMSKLLMYMKNTLNNDEFTDMILRNSGKNK